MPSPVLRSVPLRCHTSELRDGVGSCEVQGPGEEIVKHRKSEDDTAASRSFENHYEGQLKSGSVMYKYNF